MTLLRNFIGFAALALTLFACRKEMSDEDGKIPGLIDAQWEFNDAGTLFSGPMDSAFVQNVNGFNTIVMLGSAGGSKEGRIVLQIASSTLQTGEYNNSQVFFQYAEGASFLYQSSPLQSQNFSITITAIDSVSVTGTFRGTVQDSTGTARVITDGKFTAPLAGPAQSDNDERGTLMVWSKQLCSGAPIDVMVNGFTGQVTTASASQPSCGTLGTASFELPVGIYAVTAVCGNDSSFYQVVVNPDGCTPLELGSNTELPDTYLPLGMGTTWEYTDKDDASIKQTISMEGEEPINGNTYKRAQVSLPDEKRYYRQDGSDYYQYVNINFEGVTNAQPAELLILKADAPKGEVWESEKYNLTYSGVNVTIFFRMTILNRDFADVINGSAYQNLIEVRTELFVAPQGTDSYESNGFFSTVFAKGYGIVYYYDFNEDTEWQLSSSTIVPE